MVHAEPEEGERPSPWRTLGVREVYRNPWMTVVEHAVVRPDGTDGIYGIVDPGDNAAIIALDDDDHLWLAGEYAYPVQRYEWKIPSGKVEEGEPALEAAQRELAEETGLHAREWSPLGSYYPQRGHLHAGQPRLSGARTRSRRGATGGHRTDHHAPDRAGRGGGGVPARRDPRRAERAGHLARVVRTACRADWRR